MRRPLCRTSTASLVLDNFTNMSNNDLESRTIEKDTGSDISGRHDLTSEKATPYDQTSSGETTPTTPDDLENYPEGGMEAWLVVLGSWCAMVSGMGQLNVLGTYHAWISTHQLAGYSSSSVGWIFSTFPFFLYFAGVQIGPLFDFYGPRALVITGSIGLVASLMTLSVSTEYYQIILSFGVLGGLSTCCFCLLYTSPSPRD